MAEKYDLRFWQESKIFAVSRKNTIFGFGGKINFTVFTGKQDFVVLAEISILQIWWEIRFYDFGEKHDFVVLAKPISWVLVGKLNLRF